MKTPTRIEPHRVRAPGLRRSDRPEYGPDWLVLPASQALQHHGLDRADSVFVALVENPLLDALGAHQS